MKQNRVEHGPSREFLALNLREQAVEALRPFAKVGDPLDLDLSDDAVEMALQKLDQWEQAMKREVSEADGRLLMDVLALTVYVKAGFHKPVYLKEIYVKLHEFLFEHLEMNPSPLHARAEEVARVAQSYIRSLLEQAGHWEEVEQAIQELEGLDFSMEEGEGLPKDTE